MSENSIDFHLTKQIRKMLNRIEKILAPSNQISSYINQIGPRLQKILKNLQDGIYYYDTNTKQRSSPRKKSSSALIEPTMEVIFSSRLVDWNALEPEIISAITGDDASLEIPEKILLEIQTERVLQETTLVKIQAKGKLASLESRNEQPILPGRWHKEPFPPRKYDVIDQYVVAGNPDDEQASQVLNQLNTSLDGYLGQAYNYDDQGLTEEWMMTFRDNNFHASDDDVIRTQLESLLDIMTVQVQDRVCNEEGVVNRKPVGLGSQLREVPVWGIDSYTRRMVELVISDDHPSASSSDIKTFIERYLLPSINSQPAERAHNMTFALKKIVDDKPSAQFAEFAATVDHSIKAFGSDLFKIHPKGTGVICCDPAGIPPHVIIAHYLGELYPPYRWCEKLDVVQQAQEKYGLKPTLPDFYNILLERPRQDPNGYGLLYVDASRRANLGSSCSHSCNANCTSSVVAKDGKLVIVLTTNRQIYEGEELTMDYYSITTSDVEWRAAICLCGMTTCRGSFLHYATQDDLQQVLNQNCGPLWRYATLLRACSNLPLHSTDLAVLDRHGLKSSVFGENALKWILKYAAENLKFVEFERKALPCALMRPKDGKPSQYTYSAADLDARSVMEQRIQSMVCCMSLIRQFLKKQESNSKHNELPVRVLPSSESADYIWKTMSSIPELITSYVLKKSSKNSANSQQPKENVNTNTSTTASSSKKQTKKSSLTSKVEPEIPSLSQESITLLESAAKNISEKLQNKPDVMSLSATKSLCLDIRNIIISIVHLKSSTARFDQLSDILALWAHTINFSTVQSFPEVESDDVIVYARDLGNNIPRIQIFKPEVYSQRRKQQIQSMQIIEDKESSRRDDLPSLSTTTETMTTMEIDEQFPGDSGEIMYWSKELIPEFSTSEETTAFSSNADIDKESLNHPQASIEESDDEMILFAKPMIVEPQPPKKRMNRREATILSPDEAVLRASKKYEPLFLFWQLLGWFNAGTDTKIEAPDLLGCVELPIPQQCFGEAAAYDQKQRELFIQHLRDEKSQAMPWPSSLKATFSKLPTASVRMPLYGSPNLDVALGKIDSIIKVLNELGEAPVKKQSRNEAAVDTSQFDNILPPEMPTAWVQCELDKCRKWRRVAWFVDPDTLPDYWTCSMNTWDPENATCTAPQDSYNPEKESTIAYQASGQTTENIIEIGQWMDVFCVSNHIYYEAQVKEKRKSRISDAPGALDLKFHFKGWSTCFDEWIEADSDRIQPHNLYTNPVCHRVSDQEKWQGMSRPSSSLTTTKKALTAKPKAKESKKSQKRKSTGSMKSVTKKSRSTEQEIEVECYDDVVVGRHSFPEYENHKHRLDSLLDDEFGEVEISDRETLADVNPASSVAIE